MFGDDFYPTPPEIAARMLEKIDWRGVRTILEPSAGRGDLVDAIKLKMNRYSAAVDTIELDRELALVLDGKGCRPIAADFLTFHSFRQYDAIVINPPFSTGEIHLSKALDLVRDGGQVVCLLNAQTLKNPHTVARRELVTRLANLGADIEYIERAFSDAVRKTDVEIALVSVNVTKMPSSSILEHLAEAERLETSDGERSSTEIVDGDYIQGAVRRFNIEVKAGLKLIDEYEALKSILTRSFDSQYNILELSVNGDKCGDLRNGLVDMLRMKYWKELFKSDSFSNMFTKATAEAYQKQVGDLGRYEFNISNIKQLQIELSQSMLSTLDDAIVSLFDNFTNQYYDEQSNNVHYYNGWKTNKAYVVNRKVIDRCYGAFDSWDKKFRSYGADNAVVVDIEKVFAYLDGKVYDPVPVSDALKQAQDTQNTRNIDFTYCAATFYRKGTVHINFKDERLLKKFNLIGSQSKGWLPPRYGRASYDDLTGEERSVVDEVEGRESYEETVAQYDFYLAPRTDLPLLGASNAA